MQVDKSTAFPILLLSLLWACARPGEFQATSPSQPQIASTSSQNLALGKPIIVSSGLEENPGEMAVDGIIDVPGGNYWSSGKEAPQFIEIDLGSPAFVDAIRLLVSQSPNGETVHRILGSGVSAIPQVIAEINQQTLDNQWLEITVDESLTPVRFIRIQTVLSPSWVSWGEIEIYGRYRDPPVADEVEGDESPDIIFYNGVVHTMDAGRQVAEAIAINGEKVLAAGGNDEVTSLADEQTQMIDLQGATMLPGFNDSHSHLLTDGPYGGMEEAIQAALEFGYTSISELFMSQDRLDQFIALDESGQLPIRINGYLPLNYAHDRFGDWYREYPPGYEYSPYLRIAGVKIFVDNGAAGEKFLSEPYADNPAYFGDVFWTQDELNAIVLEAHKSGYQIAAHTAGDAAHDLILNALELALDGDSNEIYRHRIEHVMILRDDQLARMTDLGAIASIQLTFFNSDWRQEFESNLGDERVSWVGRWRELLDLGVPIIGSTDAPYGYGEIGSPLKAIYQAATRIGDSGQPPAPWMMDQRLSVMEAIELITIHPAYGTLQENIKGSLESGKFADLIILSADPTAIPIGDILGVQVWLNMIGGETKYCAEGQESLCP